MCAKYESRRTYPIYMVTQDCPFFTILCETLWALPPPAPLVDLSYILSRKSHNTYHINLEVFVFKEQTNL